MRSSDEFYTEFDQAVLRLVNGPVRDCESVATQLLEQDPDMELTPEVILAQILMIMLEPDGSRETVNWNLPDKVRFMSIADHMGPDYCQALYHAAVFMTRVA